MTVAQALGDKCEGVLEMDDEELELVHSKAYPPVETQWPISS